MSKRILVTGGAGFIGSHIVDLLIERGFEAVVFDNGSTGNRSNVHPGAEFVSGDVRDWSALEAVFARRFDVVMHIAGQASIRRSFEDPTADLNVNTVGTINVLRQCAAHRVPRLLFASSMTIYGNRAEVPTPESSPADPVSYYALSKYAAERYVHITAQRPDLDFDFNVTSFRMFNVYGVRQSLTNAYQGVMAIFIGNVLRGEPISIHSDGEQSRDFVNIADVSRAWVDAIDQPGTFGQVINLGTGVSQTVNTLCDMVLSRFGHTRQTYPIQYHSAQPGDMRRSAADISCAQKLLGWSPRVLFEDGMRATIEWARGHYSPQTL